jgi:hypothetical protein
VRQSAAPGAAGQRQFIDGDTQGANTRADLIGSYGRQA